MKAKLEAILPDFSHWYLTMLVLFCSNDIVTFLTYDFEADLEYNGEIAGQPPIGKRLAFFISDPYRRTEALKTINTLSEMLYLIHTAPTGSMEWHIMIGEKEHGLGWFNEDQLKADLSYSSLRSVCQAMTKQSEDLIEKFSEIECSDPGFVAARSLLTMAHLATHDLHGSVKDEEGLIMRLVEYRDPQGDPSKIQRLFRFDHLPNGKEDHRSINWPE